MPPSPCAAPSALRRPTAAGVATLSAARAAGGRVHHVQARGEQQLEPAPPASTTPASRSTGSRSGCSRTASRAAPGARAPARRRAWSRPRHRPLHRLGRRAHDGEDGALDRAQHRLVGGVGGAGGGRRRRRAPDTASSGANVSARPRRICERITPELPRAPISDPWRIASQTALHVAPSRRRARRRPTRGSGPCSCRCRRRAPGTR